MGDAAGGQAHGGRATAAGTTASVARAYADADAALDSPALQWSAARRGFNDDDEPGYARVSRAAIGRGLPLPDKASVAREHTMSRLARAGMAPLVDASVRKRGPNPNRVPYRARTVVARDAMAVSHLQRGAAGDATDTRGSALQQAGLSATTSELAAASSPPPASAASPPPPPPADSPVRRRRGGGAAGRQASTTRAYVPLGQPDVELGRLPRALRPGVRRSGLSNPSVVEAARREAEEAEAAALAQQQRREEEQRRRAARNIDDPAGRGAAGDGEEGWELIPQGVQLRGYVANLAGLRATKGNVVSVDDARLHRRPHAPARRPRARSSHAHVRHGRR